ncbi:uncharacterized protein K452DRAFT_125163 [Aplosporella prunicola CBS 121167]|uniref:Uncharacterized protein n=1 Tax=Aplosporella prunicola CBS 121167 TaxID=1176127 RepID=A0A6A6BNQ3_9PEZI|nr:uncharacterized protein K452DRAFT_125163 [Aplosporella prunicola CBS 121167]KAF2145769.1 hypothetical protein K452DRAFT_125163 [Aplosporella prunicola CBS 121167]
MYTQQQASHARTHTANTTATAPAQPSALPPYRLTAVAPPNHARLSQPYPPRRHGYGRQQPTGSVARRRTEFSPATLHAAAARAVLVFYYFSFYAVFGVWCGGLDELWRARRGEREGR